MKKYEMINYYQEGLISIVELNCASKHNYLNKQMLSEISDIFDEISKSSSHCVILKASKECKMFSSGHSIKDFKDISGDPLGESSNFRSVINQIKNFSKPIISVVNGGVYGGAFELVLLTDIVIATPDCLFAITPANFTLAYPLEGIKSMLSIIGVHHLKEMLYTASSINCHKAMEYGIVNHIVDKEESLELAKRIAITICEKSPLYIELVKVEIDMLLSCGEVSPHLRKKIERMRQEVYESQDYQEGIKAFCEKRKPNFMGV